MKLLFENWRKYINEELYHGTSDLHRQDILENGIQAPSYWGTVEIAQYYAEEAVAEKGGNPLIVKVPLSEFDQSLLKPDQNSIEEPLTYTLRKTEDEVWEEWEESDGTWQDSLEIVESVIYDSIVKVLDKDLQ